jgi:hypothetical protein
MPPSRGDGLLLVSLDGDDALKDRSSDALEDRSSDDHRGDDQPGHQEPEGAGLQLRRGSSTATAVQSTPGIEHASRIMFELD